MNKIDVIKLYEKQRKGFIQGIKIKIETKKAILLELYDIYEDGRKEYKEVWLPKSKIEIYDEYIKIPKWLAHKNGLNTMQLVTEKPAKTLRDFVELLWYKQAQEVF